ncbi:MAG: M23 family metallopeptidase [Treponema sp.]|nr:M23 family metallopeptidase [Candidatus Treponema equi]
MEVIDCFETRSRPRVKKSRAKAVSVSKSVFNFGFERSFSAKPFSMDSAWKNFCGKTLIICRSIKLSAKIFLAIPAAMVLCAIPYGASKLISYHESFFREVNLVPEVSNEAEILDGAMSEFAFGQTSYYDSEGNIFTEDSVRVSASKIIKDAVTFQNYTVRPGDTISGICQKFGLSNISTLIAVNKIGNVRSVYSGQKIRVPSTDGLIHTVAKNESIASIANKYGITATDIIDINDLSSEILVAGTDLFIPGAKLDSTTLQKAMGEIFTNPLKVRYRITSRFGFRHDPITGVASSHKGLDMACPTGTPIYACRSGKVLKSSFSPLYGNYVVIEHIDGYQTLYAHMSKALAKKGDRVGQGTKIGLVGNTGYSTGPHLHLSVYKNSKPVDPLTVLK